MFLAEDEEEDVDMLRKHRPLTKLDKVLDRSNLEQQADFARRHRELMQKIAQHVPTEKERLFEVEIDWELLLKNDILESKLRPWVMKKVTEFLGVEESDMVDFIMENMEKQPLPSELLEHLSDFLDDEAEGFVERLWKVLVFEQLRLHHLHLLYPASQGTHPAAVPAT
eukprot:Polyplicarium_translucidae@DN2943_c0_g2_i1.p2